MKFIGINKVVLYYDVSSDNPNRGGYHWHCKKETETTAAIILKFVSSL